MDTKPNPLTENFGVRGNADIEEKDGVRYVKNFRLDSISMIADPEELFRIQDAEENRQVPRFYPGLAFKMPIIDEVAHLNVGAIEVYSSESVFEKIKTLGINKELLNEKVSYSMSAELLKTTYVQRANRIGQRSGLAANRHGFLYNMFPEFPLGTETALFKKRSFDYELIGGM